MRTKNGLDGLVNESGWGRVLFRGDTESLTFNGKTLTLERLLWLAIDSAVQYLARNNVRVQRVQQSTIVMLSDGTQVMWTESKDQIRMNSDSKFGYVLPFVAENHGAIQALSSSQFVTKAQLESEIVFEMLEKVNSHKNAFMSIMIDESWDFMAKANELKVKNLSISHMIENWSEEQRARRRRNDEASVSIKLNDTILDLAEAYSSGEILTSMLDGVSAGGKTTIYRKVASLLGLPYYSTNYSLGADEDKIIGKLLPNGKGDVVFVPGEFTKAFMHGGFYVAEELNRSRSDVVVVLNNALDDLAMLELPNGHVVYRHPAFRFGMAINQGYAGTKPLDMSFVRRMNARYYIPSMTEDMMFKVAKARVPGINDLTLTLMIKVAKEIEEKYEREGIPDTVVSIDEVVHWAKQYLRKNGDFLASAIPTIINGTCLDREVNEEVLENIVKKYAAN